jgi:peptidyl-tRNA hydrolase, PTH1 family
MEMLKSQVGYWMPEYRKVFRIVYRGVVRAMDSAQSSVNNLTKENIQAPQTFLIIGLGNPGRQYRSTRHNVGFMVLDRLAEKMGLSFSRVQLRALVTDRRYQGQRIILAKPQTYMNDSGQAVAALARFYKVPASCLLVSHDDVDLPFGAIRIRPGGGSAGQKGVASIIEKLGTQDIPRLRMGVGRPPGAKVAAAYVLQEFSRQEAKELPEILDRAVEAILVFVTLGLDKAMNVYNTSNQKDSDQ